MGRVSSWALPHACPWLREPRSGLRKAGSTHSGLGFTSTSLEGEDRVAGRSSEAGALLCLGFYLLNTSKIITAMSGAGKAAFPRDATGPALGAWQDAWGAARATYSGVSFSKASPHSGVLWLPAQSMPLGPCQHLTSVGASGRCSPKCLVPSLSGGLSWASLSHEQVSQAGCPCSLGTAMPSSHSGKPEEGEKPLGEASD